MKLALTCVAAVCFTVAAFIAGMAACKLAGVPWYFAWVLVIGILSGAGARVVE